MMCVNLLDGIVQPAGRQPTYKETDSITLNKFGINTEATMRMLKSFFWQIGNCMLTPLLNAFSAG